MRRIIAGMFVLSACAALHAEDLQPTFTQPYLAVPSRTAEYTAPQVVQKRAPLSLREQQVIAEYNRIMQQRQYAFAQAEGAAEAANAVEATPSPAAAAPAQAPATSPMSPMPGTIMPIPEMGPIVSHTPLFTKVKYKDCDEKAPCSTKRVIQVLNPCKRCCTDPECVSIEICVPTCACERVKSRYAGRRVRYDYGKYAVDVRVKNGYIEVDYQD